MTNITPVKVVGIGASAGGLKPIQSLVNQLPEDTNAAFIIVQHLSPNYKSVMADLIQRQTNMQVAIASHGKSIEPNHLYVNPPNKIVRVEQGVIQLKEIDRTNKLVFPIDAFMRSLAEDQGESAIGIILSGTGSDGTAGMRAIKETGGIVMVQDEYSAQFSGMPLSVLAANLSDYVGTPDELATKLVELTTNNLFHDEEDLISNERNCFEAIIELLNIHHGVNFSLYKESTVKRRIRRRMQLKQLASLSQYQENVESNLDELELLYRDLLIGVTAFFRDREAFTHLEPLLEDLLKQKRGRELRIWIPGCSTGEEPYTMAMLLRTIMLRCGYAVNVRIFATDIDSSSIEIASAGRYPISAAAEIPTDIWKQFLLLKNDHYEVSPEIRRMVLFANHNLVADAPFTDIDLVSCRNLLIYLIPSVQQNVLDLFSFSLNKGGLLLLGASESAENKKQFEKLNNKWKIYRCTENVKLAPTLLHRNRNVHSLHERVKTRPIQDPDRNRVFDELLRERLLQQLSNAYSHDAIVVDSDYKVQYVLGNASRFLQYPTGEILTEVGRIINADLNLPVSTGIRKALLSADEFVFSETNVKLQNQKEESIRLRIQRIPEKRGQQSMVAVFFDPVTTQITHSENMQPIDLKSIASQRIVDLESELEITKESLQATVEELETTNEELQSTNEELLASNEELQSTNEELQSVNEELHTVNTEYQNKIKELTSLNEDLDNLIESSELSTLFLDEQLNIRMFTPHCSALFRLLEQDVGRPIADIKSNIVDFDIIKAIQTVHSEQKVLESTAKISSGLWFLIRILPYKTKSETHQGIVLTFVNITTQKESELALIREKEKVEIVSKAKSQFLSHMSHELRTPLNAVMGFSQLLKKNRHPERIPEIGQLIYGAGQHLLTLIDDLLDLSAIEAGKTSLSLESVSLIDAAKKVCAMLTPLADSRQITLEVNLPESLPNVQGDESRLSQVVLNLLSNAIKYNHTGGYARLDSEVSGDNVALRVVNSGKGMTELQLAKVFNEFERLGRESDAEVPGTGIGLTISKKLVELMGGSISAFSIPDGETVFTIKLPQKEPTEPTTEETFKSVNTVARKRRNKEKCQLLYVEDNRDNRKLMESIMEATSDKFELVTVGTGEEALSYLTEDQPDIIMLDRNLPDIKGDDLLSTIRSNTTFKDVPIVAVSADVAPSSITKALKIGFDDYIVKPIEIDHLLDVLESL